ncbi:MAG: 16S rRNA (guanine(527)-N(7))-methyltransferase RsmG [Nitrospiraceae bacterium]|nr:16S rRNA (guanine(527)-N(7))-methyltransferase RsmG [Nitrospiraceae bacterium]
MAHPGLLRMGAEAEKLLGSGLAQLGLAPEDNLKLRETTGKFMLYLSELKKWNRTYNLTAITEDRQIIIKHFLDSALYLKAVDGRGESIADVGSGAGFPGLVLKLLRPALSVCLIEPSWKRAAFLRHIAGRLELDRVLDGGLTVFEGKAEEMEPGGNGGARFDIAVTRALWKTPDFIKRASGIVRPGGFFIMSRGHTFAAELEGIRRKHEVLSLHLKLPFTDIERSIIIVRDGREKG